AIARSHQEKASLTMKHFGVSDHPGASRHPSSGRRGINPLGPFEALNPVDSLNSNSPQPSTTSSRLWGLFVPIYALHSKRNPNAGDLTDFENFMDWMYSLGGSVAATLPLLGAFLDEPFEPSPYSPATRLFWNEFYVDLERVPELAGHAPVRPAKKTKHVDYR